MYCFINTCSVECYWHCSDETVHYKSNKAVNFCCFSCATTSPKTVFYELCFTWMIIIFVIVVVIVLVIIIVSKRFIYYAVPNTLCFFSRAICPRSAEWLVRAYTGMLQGPVQERRNMQIRQCI